MLELVGSEDPFVPMADIADLQAVDAAVVIYEGADHGFVHDAEPPHAPRRGRGRRLVARHRLLDG